MVLNPEGSVFVVFRELSEKNHIIAIKKDDSSLFPVSPHKVGGVSIKNVPSPSPIKSSWKLCFPKGWDAPEEVTISELKSWTE